MFVSIGVAGDKPLRMPASTRSTCSTRGSPATGWLLGAGREAVAVAARLRITTFGLVWGFVGRRSPGHPAPPEDLLPPASSSGLDGRLWPSPPDCELLRSC